MDAKDLIAENESIKALFARAGRKSRQGRNLDLSKALLAILNNSWRTTLNKGGTLPRASVKNDWVRAMQDAYPNIWNYSTGGYQGLGKVELDKLFNGVNEELKSLPMSTFKKLYRNKAPTLGKYEMFAPEVGDVMVNKRPTGWSTREGGIFNKSNYIKYIVDKPSQARDIATASFHPHELEAMYPAGQAFQVTDKWKHNQPAVREGEKLYPGKNDMFQGKPLGKVPPRESVPGYRLKEISSIPKGAKVFTNFFGALPLISMLLDRKSISQNMESSRDYPEYISKMVGPNPPELEQLWRK